MTRATRHAPDPAGVLTAADELGLDELLGWIAHGPDRPPDSADELRAWAAGATTGDIAEPVGRRGRHRRKAKRR